MNINNKIQDTLYNRVRNEILKLIIEKNIGPNELLPSEGEIAELCGVSKMTSKLALNSLVEEGLVYRIPRRGSFLKDIDTNIIRNIIDNKTLSNNSSRTNFIAVVVPSLDSYTSAIVRGIEKEAKDKNYNMIIKFSNDNSDTEQQVLLEISKMPEIKGVILFPNNSNICGVELLNLKVKNYPVVIIDRAFKEVMFDCISHDHFQGAKDAVNYLIEKGHSEIGFISRGISNVTSREERYKGYINSMMENSKLIRNEYICFLEDNIIENELNQYLIRNKSITSIFCADDYIAASLYYVAMNLKKNVPEDISIIGFSDNDILNFLPVKITTIRQPVEELCSKAINILLNKIINIEAPTQLVKIKTEITEGCSVAYIKQ
jgi:GntR family transcriptional regulator, arabinose operon transcriptional repressor